jgi:hypothetical protein
LVERGKTQHGTLIELTPSHPFRRVGRVAVSEFLPPFKNSPKSTPKNPNKFKSIYQSIYRTTVFGHPKKKKKKKFTYMSPEVGGFLPALNSHTIIPKENKSNCLVLIELDSSSGAMYLKIKSKKGQSSFSSHNQTSKKIHVRIHSTVKVIRA